MRDELVNVNKMPTNLDGGKVESAIFGVLSQKSWTDFRLRLSNDCKPENHRN